VTGFAAITAGNGWLIAALGISVVFFGLASLAFLITCFPRAIAWWNARAHTDKHILLSLKGIFGRRQTKPPAQPVIRETHEPGELADAEEALRLITAHMGEPFKLPRLIEIAEQRGLAKVHSTIHRLLVKGTMVGGVDGLFRWATPREHKQRDRGEDT
jgi:hypothetical protein